jgi:hypothetical protein
MTNMLPGETITSTPPDFYADLERAIAHVVAEEDDDSSAPLAHSTDPEPDRFRDCSDEFVIQLEGLPGPDTVYTTNPDEYLALIEQATEVLHAHVSPGTPFDKTTYAEEDAGIVEHEQAHGREMKRFGNEDTVVYYGVAFSRATDSKLQFQPHVSHSGPLRKIHEAWSALAPAHGRSDADLGVAQRLGYNPADRERIQQLAEATPPLEPGWQPPKLDIDPGTADLLAELLRNMDFSNRDK